jgi:colicin import membrane protein
MQREQAARERAQAVAQAKNEYVPAIRSKVTRSWERPPGIPDSLSCTLEVRLGPGGIVTGVRVVESSGNTAFDRSAQNAVRKAEPLPVPRDRAAMSAFRNGITFEFRPG